MILSPALDDANLENFKKPEVLLHNIFESAFAIYADIRKENAQPINNKLCHCTHCE